MLLKNRQNYLSVIAEFSEQVEDEDTKNLMNALTTKLNSIRAE